MSQSQVSFFSDQFPESDFLQSDDFPHLASQQTVTSISNSDFARPLHYSFAPDSLERVGPKLRKFWVIYYSDTEMEDSRKSFVKWWLDTSFGSKKEVVDKIHWDGKKSLSFGRALNRLHMRRPASLRSCVNAVVQFLPIQIFGVEGLHP